MGQSVQDDINFPVEKLPMYDVWAQELQVIFDETTDMVTWEKAVHIVMAISKEHQWALEYTMDLELLEHCRQRLGKASADEKIKCSQLIKDIEQQLLLSRPAYDNWAQAVHVISDEATDMVTWEKAVRAVIAINEKHQWALEYSGDLKLLEHCMLRLGKASLDEKIKYHPLIKDIEQQILPAGANHFPQHQKMLEQIAAERNKGKINMANFFQDNFEQVPADANDAADDDIFIMEL